MGEAGGEGRGVYGCGAGGDEKSGLVEEGLGGGEVGHDGSSVVLSGVRMLFLWRIFLDGGLVVGAGDNAAFTKSGDSGASTRSIILIGSLQMPEHRQSQPGMAGGDQFDANSLHVRDHAHKDSSITDGTALAEDLLARCQALLKELEGFRSFVEERRAEQESAVEIRKFQTSVGTELKSLQKVRLRIPKHLRNRLVRC